MIQPILKHPHRILSSQCRALDPKSDQAQAIARDLWDTYDHLKEPGASWARPVGLAANQIGHPVRAFIALDELFINPVITWRTAAPLTFSREGCYSLRERGLWNVPRTQSLVLRWDGLDGKEHEKRFNGFPAYVIQHELDHLNGIVCASYGFDLPDLPEQEGEKKPASHSETGDSMKEE